MKPTELHSYIRDYNWDDGPERVFELLEQPEVDRATALLAYWELQGPWHSFMQDAYGRHPYAAHVAALQARLLGGFYARAELNFSPVEDLGVSKVQLLKLRRAGLPDALLTP